jgi:hypothetical protein
VPVPNEESERLCICVLDVSIVPLVTIFYWILELLRECRIYVCHFNTHFPILCIDAICFILLTGNKGQPGTPGKFVLRQK